MDEAHLFYLLEVIIFLVINHASRRHGDAEAAFRTIIGES